MRVASLSSVTARVPRRVSSRLHAWIAAAILACAGSFFLASPAFAESSLAVSLAAPVSAVGASLDLSLAISLDGPWIDASTVVEVRGPGSPMAGGAEWPVVARIERREGDLGSGEFGLDITLQPEDLPEPGAYLLSVDLIGADGKRLTTRSWCGRISNLPARVDLAVVLPVVSGIRRDPEGAFIDDLVQRAVVPEADQEGSLYGLFSAVEQNRDWHLTLGVEPLFLAQLRDLADGYRERIGGGAVREVPAGEGAARDAEQALAAFRGVAALASVQAIPAPYAMPALPILAREGWRDGFEQMQLGKLELQSTLQVAAIPDGAYAPGLDVTTDSLGAFSRASIDYIVVREDVARDLAEAPSGGGSRCACRIARTTG